MRPTSYVLDQPLGGGARFQTWTLAPADAVPAGAATSRLTFRPDPAVENWVVKVPRADRDLTDAAEELRAEAALQQTAAGPGIAPVVGVFDVVEPGANESPRPGMVSARMAGVPLAQLFTEATDERVGPAGSRDLAAALASLTRLVADIHRRGVIHGDLSPSNVLVGDSTLAVVDFGSARPVGGSHSRPDSHRRPASAETEFPVSGTPGFSAPEVVAGRHFDERADSYSVGALGLAWLAEIGGDDTRIDEVVEAWCRELTRWSPTDRPDDLTVAGSVLEGLTAQTSASASTVEFGPRPPAPKRPDRQIPERNKLWRLAPVALMVVALAAVATFGRFGGSNSSEDTILRRAPECTATEEPTKLSVDRWVAVDILGTGCAQQIKWDGHTVALDTAQKGSTSSAPDDSELRHYRVGRSGDQVFVGKWGCDSQTGITLYRPSTAEILTWSAIPEAQGRHYGVAPTKSNVGVVNGTAEVTFDDRGCAQLTVSS